MEERARTSGFCDYRGLSKKKQEVAIRLARVVSVNVGKGRNVLSNGRAIRTGIFKAPVEGPVAIHRTKVEGDEVVDLRVHGGPYKAVYLYPSEHYEFWRKELGLEQLPFASFGENLTSEG